MKYSSLLTLLVATILCGCWGSNHAPPAVPSATPTPPTFRSDPWVLIDSRSETLTVFSKDQPIAKFSNVAFGAAGVREKVRRGDDVTPRGKYTVSSISARSKFTTFIGLNYPSAADAARGLRAGTISRKTHDEIVRAEQLGLQPPQNTPLGGLIGIHGVGRGDPHIHRLVNWTAGCIALENTEIKRLARLLRPGVMVEIR